MIKNDRSDVITGNKLSNSIIFISTINMYCSRAANPFSKHKFELYII